MGKDAFIEKTFWQIFDSLILIEKSAGGATGQTLPKRIEEVSNLAKRTAEELTKDYKIA